MSGVDHVPVPSPAGATDRGWKYQLRSIGAVGVAAYALTTLLLFAVVVARLVWDLPVGDLTRDPAVVAGTHPFVGWLSNVGILGWCAAASICLFTAGVLGNQHVRRGTRRFLCAAGLFTLLMLIDDLFMLHDEVFPVYLGIGETPFYWFYGVVLGVLILVFRERILSTDHFVLVVSLLCFGASVFFDLLSKHTWVTGLFLIEDGFKLFGIVSWALYFGNLSYRSLLEDRVPK